MLVISDDFKKAMTQPIKELQAYIESEDISIRSEDDLISFEVSCDSGMCKSAMRKLKVKYLGEHNLLSQWVHAGFGVKLESGSFEYLDYGSFMVSELTFIKDTGVTEIVAYDKMVNAMKPYAKVDVTYPIGLYSYTLKLCEACGLELGNTSFTCNNDWVISQELWENINGITYRDIFVQIAQATASTCIVGNDDKIYFKPLTATGGRLTYNNMSKLKLSEIYGEINSVVLSRSPMVGEDIYLKDEISVQTNGLTEFKIENNEIVDKNREDAIIPIFNALRGVSYYPFETTTEGLGWYEIADNLEIENDTGDVFNTSLFNFTIAIDGAIKETLKTVAETKTQTQYQYATSIAKRVKNTEIIVNKQEDYIKQLVSDMYEEDGVVNEKFTQIYQNIDEIVNSVQNSGGNNLIKNSVMFAYDSSGTPSNWELEGNGTITIQSDTDAMDNGGLSGHSFTLKNKTARQRVQVTPSGDGNNVYYTFSTKIKKNIAGECYVKLYNNSEEYTIHIPAGESPFYADYEIKGISPKENYFIVEFYGSAISNATFTDNMLTTGEYKSQWTQANGEVMNTQVNINLDGVLVRSSVYVGDYTVMSPLEFAGYSNINGRITKVFSLNKDVTSTTKLEAKDEFKMIPLKVVPLTEGDILGWAFVPSTEV